MSENWGRRSSTSPSRRNDQPTNTVTGPVSDCSSCIIPLFRKHWMRFAACCFTVLHATSTINHSKTYLAAWTNVTRGPSSLGFQTWPDRGDSCGNSLILVKKRKKSLLKCKRHFTARNEPCSSRICLHFNLTTVFIVCFQRRRVAPDAADFRNSNLDQDWAGKTTPRISKCNTTLTECNACMTADITMNRKCRNDRSCGRIASVNTSH